MMAAVRLKDASEEALYGGKCVSLGSALRAGLPTPDGYALEVDFVAAISRGDEPAIAAVRPLFAELAPAMAVRSSAVGEDSEDASFAGQHVSILNVMNADAMVLAIEQVHDSASTPEALAYRGKMGVRDKPAIAVVLQQQIQSEVSGVMFTRHPLSAKVERYVEASWGLGEAIVAGLVVPDGFRIGNDGAIIARIAGEKDIKLVSTSSGEVEEVEVEADKVEALCLDDRQLLQLHQLASDCEAVYGQHIDIEWAFHAGNLYLLQCRAITI
jgi:pyruvate,water dikinase